MVLTANKRDSRKKKRKAEPYLITNSKGKKEKISKTVPGG